MVLKISKGIGGSKTSIGRMFSTRKSNHQLSQMSATMVRNKNYILYSICTYTSAQRCVLPFSFPVDLLLCAVHRDAFCQSLFHWIYYCHSSKTTGKETVKTHLCTLVWSLNPVNGTTTCDGTWNKYECSSEYFHTFSDKLWAKSGNSKLVKFFFT